MRGGVLSLVVCGCMWMYVDASGGVFNPRIIGCDSGVVTSSTFWLYSFLSISVLLSIRFLLAISSVSSTFLLLTKL